jgi:hypothetical protein
MQESMKFLATGIVLSLAEYLSGMRSDNRLFIEKKITTTFGSDFLLKGIFDKK